MAQNISSPTFKFTGVSPAATAQPDRQTYGQDAGIDDLANALAGSFQVTSSINNPNAPHPRFSQYKMRYSSMDQNERRKKYLQLQKEKRFNAQSLVRRLASNKWDDAEKDELEGDNEEEEQAMDITQVQLRRPGRQYKNQLMFSEWMLEVPDDFETDWMMVPCPVGKRNLVVASGGQTQMYTKNGYRMKSFPSSLPGGHKSMSHWHEDCTIVDCIFSEVTNTFYCLDMMSWKRMPLYDSETEFRFYWLHTQFAENPEVKQVTKKNPYHFEALPNFSCSKENLEQVMSATMNLELDGLLFYHKKAHYTFGATPLVLWLKAYMLPELLKVPVPAIHFQNVPSDYTGFSEHVDKVRQEKEQTEQMKKAGITPKKKTPQKQIWVTSPVTPPQSQGQPMQSAGSSGKKKRRKKKSIQRMETGEAAEAATSPQGHSAKKV